MSLPTETATPPNALVDGFGRRITYLRLSVTDRCDFRCLYCMPPGQRFAARDHVLGEDDMHRIGAAFVSLGVRKIRLTGGEPLMHPGIVDLTRRLSALPGLHELALTTNGTQLEHRARDLLQAGIRRVNISLDSLKPDRFSRLTRKGDLRRVLRGIDAAVAAGFERVKLNVVMLEGRNHDELIPLVRFAIERDINISFIEEMPMGAVADHPRAKAVYSSARARADLEQHFELIPSTETTGGPARYYRIPGTETRVGFISPHSHNFCSDCNRVRVTAEGRLLLCLGQEHSLDLHQILRDHPGDDQLLVQRIQQSMAIKPKGHDFQIGGVPVILRGMNHTGG